MKTYAFYLPQFHEIPENNEWHEPGFTEWTNVKRTMPLYNGHVQPLHPLNGNYYNLLNKDTVTEQVDMAKKYGIDGFVYYHYWFQGKKLLEKPAENFLQWKEIEHDFFFCWANHSFLKKWDGSNIMLLEQTYGTEADWKIHFEYLLPFFKDERYVKIDNKPVFMIYRATFPEKDSIIECFDKLARENGFDGIYYAEVSTDYPTVNSAVDGLYKKTLFHHMPNTAITVYEAHKKAKIVIHKAFKKLAEVLNVRAKCRVCRYSADELIAEYMKHNPNHPKQWAGLFFAWDNTPRYGNRGYSIKPMSKKMFFKYMDYVSDKDIVIINAWNEWAEGMILEPSEEYGYKYLEWIAEWKSLNH